MNDYAVSDRGRPLDPGDLARNPDEIAFYLPDTLPQAVVPIYDEETRAVIGFRGIHGYRDGVPIVDGPYGSTYAVYDLEGRLIGHEVVQEPGLEPSYIIEDTILFFTGIGALRALFSAGRLAVAQGGRLIYRSIAVGVTAATVGRSTVTGLRVAHRVLTTRQVFLFTATTARHMADSARHVPVHILYLAVKYGRRVPDPQGVAGAFRFTIPLRTISGRTGEVRLRELEVVIRTQDWTILHFLYK